jgi:Tol biopolymer transport system component
MVAFCAPVCSVVTIAFALTPSALARSNGPIAFVAGSMGHGQIYTVQPSNKHVRKLTHTGDNRFPVVSPNGKVIVFIRVHGSSATIYSMSSTGQHLRPLTTISSEFEGEHLSFSPNGRQIAFTNVGSTTTGGVTIMRADGTHVHRITEHGFNYPTYSPNGKQILYWTSANNDLEQGVFTMSLTGAHQKPIILNPSYYFTDFSVAPSGRLVFDAFQFGGLSGTCGSGPRAFSLLDQELGTATATGSRFSLLTSAADCDNTEPAFSPNGRQIAFLSDRNSAQPGVYNLFTMTASGANVAQLTHFSAGVSAPAW